MIEVKSHNIGKFFGHTLQSSLSQKCARSFRSTWAKNAQPAAATRPNAAGEIYACGADGTRCIETRLIYDKLRG
jgi:hypothetical protein